jgi:hypothetical protein
VASALGGTFFRKCELIYNENNIDNLTEKKNSFVLTLARDSAFNKITPDSSASASFGLDCSPPVTKTINLFY